MRVRAFLYVLGGVAWALVPVAASAALVPCGASSVPTATGSLSCDLCYLGQLIQNIINFLIGLSIPLAAALFAWAGVMYFTAGGSEERIGKAHKIFTNVLIGFLVVLGAWLLVQTTLKALFKDDFFLSIGGSWNTLNCGGTREQRVQTTSYNFSQFLNSSLPGLTVYDPSKIPQAARLSEFTESQQVAMLTSTTADLQKIQEACAQNGYSDCTNYIRAIETIESRGNPNIGCSNAGACGLMQLKPATARILDPSLSGLTDAQVIEKLNKDADYNRSLGTKYYGQMLQKFNDPTLAAAAYNAGPGAVEPNSSRDCPGLRAFECPWDSPGCYGTGRTDCKVNTGYQETRNYIKNFNNILTRLK